MGGRIFYRASSRGKGLPQEVVRSRAPHWRCASRAWMSPWHDSHHTQGSGPDASEPPTLRSSGFTDYTGSQVTTLWEAANILRGALVTWRKANSLQQGGGRRQ